MRAAQSAKRQHLYLGKAGHFAVMAECLYRGYNVAVPEVDIGDDLFVINDASGDYRRVQVKTATGKWQPKSHYQATFPVPLLQLQTAFTPDLTYVFAVRFSTGWGPFLVIPRSTLDELRELKNLGSVAQNRLMLVISYAEAGDSAYCSKVALTRFINRFERLPEAAEPFA